ncbi:MAG: sugar phosphate isomerase/epimerase [Phycisphaerae bacterium]|jgi:sugar phosphate isomerase/epimerase
MSSTLTRRHFVAGTLSGLSAGAWLASGCAPSVRRTDQAAEPAQGYQIGCYTRPWADQDYRVALDAIAEAGFRYCGLMNAKGGFILSLRATLEQASQAGEEARRRGLRVLSAYGGDIPLDSVAGAVAGLRKLIDHCAAAGSANLLMGGVGDEKVYGIYYKAIAECCDYAAEKKVSISLKPHGGLNATGRQLRRTIEEVGHRNFRVWYDAGNVYYYSDGRLEPVQDAADVSGLVAGWCIKDYLPPKNVDVTPGTGKVDFAGVLAVLRQGGFTRGPLVVETLARGDLPARLAEARKARAFVERLVSA